MASATIGTIRARAPNVHPLPRVRNPLDPRAPRSGPGFRQLAIHSCRPTLALYF